MVEFRTEGAPREEGSSDSNPESHRGQPEPRSRYTWAEISHGQRCMQDRGTSNTNMRVESTDGHGSLTGVWRQEGAVAEH